MKMKKYSYILVFVLMLVIGINGVYAASTPTCGQIISDDLHDFIDEILTYIKIAVPIIVIALGIIDLAKAVLAGKEDEMRKAQSTFIKRVLIGVCIFFVDVFVDVIIYFAEIVMGTINDCR